MAAPRLWDWDRMETAPKNGTFVELLLKDNQTSQLFGCGVIHRWDGFRWREKDGTDIHPSISPAGWRTARQRRPE
jgi:hypothetical protein